MKIDIETMFENLTEITGDELLTAKYRNTNSIEQKASNSISQFVTEAYYTLTQVEDLKYNFKNKEVNRWLEELDKDINKILSILAKRKLEYIDYMVIYTITTEKRSDKMLSLKLKESMKGMK